MNGIIHRIDKKWMVPVVSLKKELVKGTLILTAAGFAARLLGFFNRVYLANLLSNAEIGRYQLIFPIFMFCMAISCVGIQTAVSKMVAGYHGEGKIHAVRQTVSVAVAVSFGLSLLCSIGVFYFSKSISLCILKDSSCQVYLKMMAIAIPFAALHSCLSGYFYGIRKTAVPAMGQLMEQVVRVSVIYLLSVTIYQNRSADASIAVWGLAAGEIFSFILTWCCYCFSMKRQKKRKNNREPWKKIISALGRYGGMLTANRVSVSLLQSTEMFLLPLMLAKYEGSTENALAIFGIVTGMVLPVILLPQTVSNAMASLLLPAVAEANESHHDCTVAATVRKTVECGLLMGLFSGLCFGVFGTKIGEMLFHNNDVGMYIQAFAVLCPLMYIQPLLAGALNGLGKMNETLFHHVIASGIRLYAVLGWTPKIGIYGYLVGIFVANAVVTVIAGVRLYQIIKKKNKCSIKRD